MTQFRDVNSSRRNSVTQIPADIFTKQFTTSKNCEFLEQSHLGNCFAAESFRELFHCRVLSVIVLLQSHLGNCFTAESSRSSFCCRVISGTVLLQSHLGNNFAAKSSRKPLYCRVLSGTVALQSPLGNRFTAMPKIHYGFVRPECIVTSFGCTRRRPNQFVFRVQLRIYWRRAAP